MNERVDPPPTPPEGDLFERLRAARRVYGDLFAVTRGRAAFTSLPDCAGCVAVLGAAHLETVLKDLERFRMPISLEGHPPLPPRVANLNAGLFSMTGAGHRHRRHRFACNFSGRPVARNVPLIKRRCDAVIDGWRPGQTIDLLAQMRRLAWAALHAVLFGADEAAADPLGALVQAHLAARRAYARAPEGTAADDLRATLVADGLRLDRALRARVRRARARTDAAAPGLIAQLGATTDEHGQHLSEDEVVAHAHAMFLAGTEPVAVALTWTVLLLSQHPTARAALARASARGGEAQAERLGWVIQESLRLLPPNALMLRVTDRPVTLDGERLPARCEILLSPFLAHREPALYPQPERFLPSRWRTLRPSPYEYLPFGAGPKFCLGHHLALRLMTIALERLLARTTPLLVDDQRVDWWLPVTLMPREPVRVTLHPPGTHAGRRGRGLRGTLTDLVPALRAESPPDAPAPVLTHVPETGGAHADPAR